MTTTLTDYLAERAEPGLARLLDSLAFATKQIAASLGRAGLENLTGAAGATSHQGEEQQKLDILADERLREALGRSKQACIVGSEEHKELLFPVHGRHTGRYCVLYDPLDGSSNIDAGISTGTIFAVYPRSSPPGEDPTEADVLRPGRDQVCAGYAIYSSATVLVLALDGQVDGFTLDRELGTYVLSHPRIQCPPSGKIYSCNEANFHTWNAATQAYIAGRRETSRGRYIGSLVADFHRNLLYGGLFLYPADCRGEAPKAKLRLCYEGHPLAFVSELAGGGGTTGSTALLDIAATDLHQREPLILGSADDVAAYEAAIAGG